MGPALAKILAALAWRLFSEKVVSEFFVNIGWSLVTSTKNELDDKLMRTVAEALNVKVVEKEVAQ